MKVLPFKIPKTQNIGLIYQEDKEKHFYDKFHQHEEIQLCVIVKGEGTLIVGDTINKYSSGDVLVIGSNLPHVFKSDASVIKESFMISLFFTKSSFGKDFFLLDDFKELIPFFDKSISGFRLLENKEKVTKLFLGLHKSSNLNRFIGLLEILKTLVESETAELASFIYPKRYTDNEGKRMQNVMDYTINNFDKNIDLYKIAEKANMTPNAFCRYFKQRTNKTYFTFLNELRIENACKLLTSDKSLPISSVAYRCGFNNLSNFNRKFKEVKNVSPTTFKKKN
ncbi:AraC family transcriptional regulator [Tenacibaculum larymnensis]|uniref:Helix-turn-helix transcriptional regulator n=1 Tax=Tenacibaculum larymnensis TaxID=2878201 RepID=A0A9X4IKQ2_9FLAO|nr:helix-turn-helix transcriptional regulator [Tenacibaculum larymnensis]MDE1205733.1 helix-turn-helix transcriptional regulator [Tenacibaculum larymnensis]